MHSNRETRGRIHHVSADLAVLMWGNLLLLLCDVGAQVTRPSKLYWGGEKAVFEALGNAKRMRLVDHVGLIGYKADQVSLIGRRGRLAEWAYRGGI